MKRNALRRAVAVAASVGIAAALTACSSGGSPAQEDGPVTLTYWTWAPGVAQVVDTWNAQHPEIQVKVEQPPEQTTSWPRCWPRSGAGEGPDIFAAEYQKVPNLVLSGAGYDISSMIGDAKADFTDSTWSLVTVGDGVYAVPQDTGPMVFMYRADIFAQHGWQVPTTFDEYAALAAQVRTTLPNTYLGGFPDEGATLAAYSMQAGAQWWSTEGDAWKVDIDGAPTRQVLDFWEPLVRKDLISTTHFFTPEWNTALNDGTLLSWMVGVWGPGSIASVAPDTAGDWRIAKMPAWRSGETATGLFGGSSAMVGATTKHAKQAVEFLTWLNGSKEGSSLLAEGGLFPASVAGQESLPSLEVPKLATGQSDFWQVASQAASDAVPFTWGPNVQFAFDSYSDSIKKALTGGTPWTDVLTSTQDAVIGDLKNTGFTVQ
ncbi:hypothetical protein LUZ63_021695 [Rhynchospora breviuscula]|uniref:Sugar ABC transporter substrate-binding protein n=1 Tax=Rhynchospora breviuscula TaxID=2022672 RepID=A0A9P9Z678_9POAL|nr:hypothetical protein LUZ63_021695 [Rhynchospora breviuscula]